MKKNTSMKTVIACMIVKDEVHIIARCLDSLKPIISGIAIVDTGSSDGTPEAIETWGEENGIFTMVPRSDWKGFAGSRNEALELGRTFEWADFAIMIDADEVLRYADGFDSDAWLKSLDSMLPFYEVETRRSHVTWTRPQLINLRAKVAWRGAVHEFLEAHGARGGRVHEFYNEAIQDSARNARGAQKYLEDAAAILSAKLDEPDVVLRSRYTFYAAQSYRDGGDTKKAIMHYGLRWTITDGWNEERYVAAWQAGKLLGQDATSDSANVLEWFDRATAVNSSRVEALHEAIVFCRGRGDWSTAWIYCRRALEVIGYGAPVGVLFPEAWRYDYGVFDEAAVVAYWIGLPKSSWRFCNAVFNQSRSTVPADVIARNRDNLVHAASLAARHGDTTLQDQLL